MRPGDVPMPSGWLSGRQLDEYRGPRECRAGVACGRRCRPEVLTADTPRELDQRIRYWRCRLCGEPHPRGADA